MAGSLPCSWSEELHKVDEMKSSFPAAATCNYFEPWVSNRSATRLRVGLLDCGLGAVAVAVDELILQRLVLLVLHAQRLAFIVDELHVELVVSAVLLDVRGLINDFIFGANHGVDGGDIFGKLT